MNLKMWTVAVTVLAFAQVASAQNKIQPTSVNAASGNQPSASAVVDGNPSTQWNAGGFPLQWIQIDLGATKPVTKVRALAAQHPAGQSTHSFHLRDANGNFIYSTVVAGDTSEGQWLEVDIPAPTQARYVYIETTPSPSWTAWAEIEAYESAPVTAGGAVISSCFLNGNDAPQPQYGFVIVGSAYDPGKCPMTTEKIRFEWRNIRSDPSGTVVRACFVPTLPSGWSYQSFQHEAGACYGFQAYANGRPISNVTYIRKN